MKNKSYISIVKEKGWDVYSHQQTFIENPLFEEPKLPLVLAVGTGGGKTFTTLIKLDIYYSNPANKGKKTIIFSHATHVIKDNFEGALEKYGDKSFNYCIVKEIKQIESAFNDPNCDVIIMLPQTIKNHLDKVNNVEWMIVDEAHEWYGESVYNTIIDSIKPKYQLLLTGTPSKFNKKEDKFLYHHTSVDELRQLGKLGNAKMLMVTSDYIVNNDDILPSGNVKETITNTKNKSSLYRVCEAMLKSLSNNESTIDDLFTALNKTIIFCRSQKQANQFYSILKKELKGKVLKSLSEDNSDSSEFKDFAKKDDIKVLILVRKGRLGFDMPNLYNIVDFTLSTNVDNISQMVGRILRPDGKDTIKNFYKISSPTAYPYYEGVMKVVLRLMMPDAYKIYDGNQNQVVIPRSSTPTTNTSENEEPNSSTNTSDNESQSAMRNIDPDIIGDLDFFHKIEKTEDINSKYFDINSWCTLDDVRRECFGMTNENWTIEKVLKKAKEFKYKNEFREKAIGAYVAAKRFKIYKQATAHMKDKKLPKGYWEDSNNVIKEGKKFKTISLFEKKYSAGAKAARKFDLVKIIWPEVGSTKTRPINPNSKRQMKLQIKNKN